MNELIKFCLANPDTYVRVEACLCGEDAVLITLGRYVGHRILQQTKGYVQIKNPDTPEKDFAAKELLEKLNQQLADYIENLPEDQIE